jgi:hypothetical protein
MNERNPSLLLGLLCSRREWQGCRGADKTDEIAPPH